jgi:hypothetical protein
MTSGIFVVRSFVKFKEERPGKFELILAFSVKELCWDVLVIDTISA